MKDENTFFTIKNSILKVAPDAKIFLFGSRVTGTAHDESDWDILILLKLKPDKKLKNTIHDAVFPLSLQIKAFINTIIVSEEDWDNNPSYYALHQSVSNKLFLPNE